MIGANINSIETTPLLSAVGVKPELELIKTDNIAASGESFQLGEKNAENLKMQTRFRRLKKRCKSRSSSIL